MPLRRLRELREEKQRIENRKVTQQEIADTIGISQQRYYQYESLTNDPDFEVVTQLSNYFNVSTDYLLGVSDLRFVPLQEDIRILQLIHELPIQGKDLISCLSPEDIRILELIHSLPHEHKECLLKIKPSDVELLDYLHNLSDRPAPYVIEGHLLGIPKNLTIAEVDELRNFLDFICERHAKREQENKTSDK